MLQGEKWIALRCDTHNLPPHTLTRVSTCPVAFEPCPYPGTLPQHGATLTSAHEADRHSQRPSCRLTSSSGTVWVCLARSSSKAISFMFCRIREHSRSKSSMAV